MHVTLTFLTERRGHAGEPASENGGRNQREQIHSHSETPERDDVEKEGRGEPREGHKPASPGAE